MASRISNLTRLGDSKHGGALFTLPREIRDVIYRFLVKGRYLVFRHLKSENRVSFIERESFDSPDLIIFRISKAISHEAQQVHYSESIFRYEVPFYTTTKLQSTKEAVNRMKKIELDIYGLKNAVTTYYYNRSGEFYIPPINMPAICETILGDFAGTDVLRDSLHIIFHKSTPEIIISPLRSYVLPKLCALSAFRTIVLEVFPRIFEKLPTSTEEYEEYKSSYKWSTAEIEQVRQAIKDAMELTLGPATSHGNDSRIHLEFHPREDVPAILRAQAQRLNLAADRLDQGR